MQKFDNFAVFGVHDDNTLAQLRDVASRAARAAILADGHVGYVMPIGGVAAYREKVSVVGVGFDIACLARGTPVVTRDGHHLPIERVAHTDPVICWDGACVRPVAPHMGAIPRGVKLTITLRLANGRTIAVTADHEIWTLDGWREAGSLVAGERVACTPFVGLPYDADDGEVPLALEHEGQRAELGRRGLYPLRRNAPAFAALLRLLGYVSGDGHLPTDGSRVSVYTTVEEDAREIERDFRELGFEPCDYRRVQGPRRKAEIHVCVNSTALHTLFSALGSPVGQKRWPKRPMRWLLESPAWMRAHWLSAFASAEMMTPRAHANGVVPNLQLEQSGENRNAIEFIASLLESLGFEVSVARSGEREGSRQDYVLQILGGQSEQLRFFEQVGFCYAHEKRARAADVASVIWRGRQFTATRELAKAEARELHAAEVGYRDVLADVPNRFGETPPPPDTEDEICWVPVESIEPGERVAVYDVVTGDPAHCFFANGIVVHNCGNAAIRTDVTLQDFAKNPKHAERDLNRLADSIASTVSFGVGLKNRADDAPTDDPLFDDPAWDAVPAKERKALKDKARGQLGTVGSGNHYVDVFADRATGELWVGVHFGSRGFGHTVASNFLALGQGKQWGERAPEQEVLLDLADPVGEGYWALMNLAGRYAYAGREWVARKVVEMIGAREVELVHNHHNFAFPEVHNGENVIVVRKGSTPAFPGQKGFVGGSMGDDAVILRGATAASPEVREMQEAALFSTVHGAGRVMSRTQAAGKRNRRTGKQLSPGRISPEMMKEWLKEKNVILRGGGLDEAPQAYRRLPEVLAAQGPTVEVLHVLQPLIVVMAGADEFDPYKD
ncbi:MAG TPA: RtcB family protein [Gemmatimonadaceae bacterium]|nr:RtcB family protein [Gemmatimonadaceae bacterium]